MIRADHLLLVTGPRAGGPVWRALPAASRWAIFWDDRKAISLKIVFLIVCVAAAALLETPW